MNPDSGLNQLDKHRENERDRFKNRISKLLRKINDENDFKTYLCSGEAVFFKYHNETYIEIVIHFDDIEKVELNVDGYWLVDINGYRQKIE